MSSWLVDAWREVCIHHMNRMMTAV